MVRALLSHSRGRRFESSTAQGKESMSEISKTINEILKVDEELSKKIDEAKIQAKKIIDSAKSEVEEYRTNKHNELEEFKKSLSETLHNEISNYKNEIKSKVDVICASVLEISKSKKKEVVEDISSSIFSKIIGVLLSK